MSFREKPSMGLQMIIEDWPKHRLQSFGSRKVRQKIAGRISFGKRNMPPKREDSLFFCWENRFSSQLVYTW